MDAIKPYDEVVDFLAAGTTPESIVSFVPSIEARQRVSELLEGNRNSNLSAEEESELEDYLELEHILILAKARAQQHVRVAK